MALKNGRPITNTNIILLGTVTPSGTISSFGNETPPPGYLICDGSEVSRTEYSSLFAAIGTNFGSGNGTTTFNIPDLRGRFLRGVDDDANNDPDKASRTAMNVGGNTGNSVGSIQGDAIQNHIHASRFQVAGAALGSLANSRVAVTTSSGNTEIVQNVLNANTSSETRPKNANVQFCIKI